jgi:hypothetical protein
VQLDFKEIDCSKMIGMKIKTRGPGQLTADMSSAVKKSSLPEVLVGLWEF